MNKKNNYIWLFGENLGNTANNNSFYFWKHIVNKDKNKINKYFVLTRNIKNIKFYKKLNVKEKKSIVWKNSFKHCILYQHADMLFVTLSYLDVIPKIYTLKKEKKYTKPIIYLQHGVLAIKKIDYTGKSYNRKILRFVCYNKEIKDQLIEKNDFRKYQLYYGKFMPRWKELAIRYEKLENKERKISWFITWRDYLNNGKKSNTLIDKITRVIKNEKLTEYLEKNNIKLEIILHQFFVKKFRKLFKEINSDNVIIVNQNKADVMQSIADSELLITDYSSVGFDATLLNKPVILFFPDLEEYLRDRDIYCTVEELREYGTASVNNLIDKIVNNKYEINEFFKSKLPNELDLQYLKDGKHIDKMYAYFKKLQKNKITFLGYNFYGEGGTVSATRSLAEGLLEKGYMVELMSLKKTKKEKNIPYGLNMSYLYHSKSKSPIEIFKRNKIIWNSKNLKYLEFDSSKEFIAPYAGYKLEKILKKLRSNTVISTRESIHQFVIDAMSNKIKNKIFFFHCPTDFLDELFPGLIEELKEYQIHKAVFVTEKNRKSLEEKAGYNKYDKYLISGNALERRNCININRIEAVPEKEIYRGIYLLRINKERIPDINNLINFAEYLKNNKINNIVIDVFGTGNYLEDFLNILEEKGLEDIIIYNGLTKNPTHHIRHHDVLVDFSVNQSFGMTYLEGILNGRMVFCLENDGSLEVLKDIPGVFIKSNEDLVNKFNSLPSITKEQLQENYRNIENRFSRKVVAGKFIDFLNEE